MERELDFLNRLREQVHAKFGEEVGAYLFGIAAGEFLSGPHGVSAMFSAEQPTQPRTKN